MAEENTEHTEDTEHHENEEHHDDGAGKKNVSYEDFKALSDKFDSFGEKIANLVDSQGKDNHPKNDNEDKKDGKGSGKDDEKDIKLPPEIEKRLSDNEKKIAAYQAKDEHNKLVSFAREEAKKQGIKNIDGVLDNLIGKDQETTKANISNMAETIKANAKTSTDRGHGIKSSQFKNSDDFMASVYKSKGLLNNKK